MHSLQDENEPEATRCVKTSPDFNCPTRSKPLFKERKLKKHRRFFFFYLLVFRFKCSQARLSVCSEKNVMCRPTCPLTVSREARRSQLVSNATPSLFFRFVSPGALLTLCLQLSSTEECVCLQEPLFDNPLCSPGLMNCVSSVLIVCYLSADKCLL